MAGWLKWKLPAWSPPNDPEIQKSYYLVDTGLISGNVYLFAGLASWFRIALRPEQRVLFAQSIGWPADAEPRS